jgi:phenylalanyl-tRNA synthetase beta chain
LDLDVPVVGFEVDLAALVERALPKAGELSRFPSVRRDLAFTLAEDVAFAAIQQTVRDTAGPLLRQVLLFDRYVGAGVETGQKSLAMGLILQDNTRTLNDRDVDTVVAETVAALARDHGARIRG